MNFDMYIYIFRQQQGGLTQLKPMLKRKDSKGIEVSYLILKKIIIIKKKKINHRKMFKFLSFFFLFMKINQIESNKVEY